MSFVLGNTLIKRNSSGFAIPTFETPEWRMQWKNTRRPRTPLDFNSITAGAFIHCAPNVDDIATGMGLRFIRSRLGRILFWLYSNANMDPSVQDGGRYHSCHATTDAVVSGLIGEDISLTFAYPSTVSFLPLAGISNVLLPTVLRLIAGQIISNSSHTESAIMDELVSQSRDHGRVTTISTVPT
ncbi:hypothetical protein AGABI2DRAFT_121897 [Agaricus bisporus var. bisporus H97]|uniref:hypothetical protein n=1 Tax=Agaricus bisporus var. bisporus (strain H97 / ATCC MYA-4626 / FGSC 10389) TaxID=936046 RepID=UPI00029F556B|nr:hypothetical protein AGABI2DRAFT_121897 [Agaricus bisporus var. bisporus H97]EKV42999.1 hypothetical protein AGABI2DRAFT_121897 [Agaricus bisporus var. bisporus H97]